MTEVKPWEIQPDEPPRAYNAFILYRDMLHRSLAKLAALTGKKSSRSLEKMSSKYGWQKRVAAWDREQDRRLRALQSDDIAEMQKRHIRLGLGMQTAVVKELGALVNQVEEAAAKAVAKAVEEGRDPAKAHHTPVLSVNELIRLSEAGVNLERLSRGEPTESTEIKADTPDLSSMSIEDLRALRKIQKKYGQ